MFTYFLIIFIFLNVFCDINYLVRTIIAVLSGGLYQRKYSLNETTTIYVFVAILLRNGLTDFDEIFCAYPVSMRIGQHLFFIPLMIPTGTGTTRVEPRAAASICTFQDCDITFKHIRIARLLRDLDFARYHFYERTGIYRRSRELGIKSLQGCTLTLTEDPVPLFRLYKINTKLVYWDDRSLFLEHEVITLSDGKVRSVLLSRQHAIGRNGYSTQELLAGLPASDIRSTCPEYIQRWLRSMEISSSKLRRNT